MSWIHFLLVWMIFGAFSTKLADSLNVNKQYGRQELLSLCPPAGSLTPRTLAKDLEWLEEEVRSSGSTRDSDFRGTRRIRRRGRRGGVRAQLKRRGNRTPLPTVMFGNVRSLRNKTDELAANCRFLNEYRNSAIISVTETWLEERDGDGTVSLDGFRMVRADRKNTMKKSGGGVAVFINDKWCNNVTTKETHCCDNLEFLVVSCRPYYLPREFNNVFIFNVYIPPSANMSVASELLLNSINKFETSCPESVKIIVGDFNGCNFHDQIPAYEQYVKCTTRGDSTLDLMFCNIKDGYRVVKKTPLGNSDHNMLYCMPVYKQKLKREKQKKVTIKRWSEESICELQGCFMSTDWSVLYDDNSDIDANVDVMTSYIVFCTEMIVPSKTVTIFPNNKPWVKKDLKIILNEKKRALSSDRNQVKSIQKRLERKISSAKKTYKEKVERQFRTNNLKDAWQGLKQLSGYQTKQKISEQNITKEYANELNTFFARFDIHNFENNNANLRSLLSNTNDRRIEISLKEVCNSLKRVKTGKACGPDGVSARVLKSCREQLTLPLHKLFQASLDQSKVPAQWKLSKIIPIPKTRSPKVNNDFRPVALTCVIFKCFESIVKNILCRDVIEYCDPRQFAYSAGRSVQDAVLTMNHEITSHLETLNSYIRILYVDFSSAFNTIQPHLLIDKLLNMNVNSNLISWILDFLLNRTQFVSISNIKSDVLTTNTGAPQGCVLSPILFTIYTNDCQSNHRNVTIMKYADDTAIIGKISNGDENNFLSQVNHFVLWSDQNYLNLNVLKTKEMIIDFRKNQIPPAQLVIKSQTVERVDEYKYLGIMIDNKLTGNSNTKLVYSKCNQRVHHLRILNNIRVDKTIISLLYKSIVESIITFSITTWFSTLRCKDKNKLNKIVKQAKRLGANVMPLEEIYKVNVIKQAKKIMMDETHPLHHNYVYLRSGRRLQAPVQRTSRYKNSFVPRSIKMLNSNISFIV